MPYTMAKTNGGFSVSSPHGTKAKKTTKKKAKAQIRLLQAKEHDPTFTPYTEDNLRYPRRKR